MLTCSTSAVFQHLQCASLWPLDVVSLGTPQCRSRSEDITVLQLMRGRNDDPTLLGNFGKEVSGVAWHLDDVTNLATCCDDSNLHVWRPMSLPYEAPLQVSSHAAVHPALHQDDPVCRTAEGQ